MHPPQGRINCGHPQKKSLTEKSGAGAGQAIEDDYILGRALHGCLSSHGGIQECAGLYQDVRLPRAQKAQRTAREAGDVYKIQAEGLKGLDYEAYLPKVRDRLKNLMKWVWSEEIDDAYERMTQDDSKIGGFKPL